MAQNPLTEQLAALAAHLHDRREAILRIWQRAVERDPLLTTSSTLSRAQFNDHIPGVLDSFEHKLSAIGAAEQQAATREERATAAEHGLIRWQQGYDEQETMLEWGHLQLCLLDELEAYAAAHPGIDGAMVVARRELVLLCSRGVGESAARYMRLQRTEAAGRVAELEQALAQVAELQKQRADIWREATHDLRGSVGVISTASAVLDTEGLPDETRMRVSQMVQRGLQSLRDLLNELASLARLEAGQERREVAEFDTARVVGDLCATTDPLARERNLFLRTEGPESLRVEGDAVKVLRIAQNLVLNAIKYTERGGVKVSWSEVDAARWALVVQDSGPGLVTGGSAPMEKALREATDEVREVLAEERAAEAGPPPRPLPSLSPHRPSTAGEGIGLSIVKRLCELLDATLELESKPGEGTTFRVVFPRRY